MMNDDTYFGQVRHWLVTDIITKPDGSLSIPTGAGPTPYLAPSPLPNYLYSRPHRYVFILARGTSGVEVTADDLRELQKPYVAAVAGNQDVQDIKDRWGFNAQELMKMKGLKVEAVTFMGVGGTLKSGVETTSMMMQGAVNKVSSLL
jgi:Icc-related predicted phosphoesterase